jgi:hypothetical protein
VANASPLVDELLYRLPSGVSPTGSPVILTGGDILLPTSDGNVVRLAPGSPTTQVWATAVTIPPEFPVGVAAADTTTSAPAIYVTTNKGNLIALDGSGAIRWSGTLEAGAVLGFPTIAPIPSAAPTAALWTLYTGSSTGKLFRVVVDSGLDTSAPWPKAHHDIRNTASNAP